MDGPGLDHVAHAVEFVSGRGMNVLETLIGMIDREKAEQVSIGLLGHGGNDLLNGGPGIDVMIGSEGDDRLEWVAGDELDSFVAGGGGSDTLAMLTSDDGERVDIGAVEIEDVKGEDRTQVTVSRPAGIDLPETTEDDHPSETFTYVHPVEKGILVDVSGGTVIAMATTEVERFEIDTAMGPDSIEVADLQGSEVEHITLDLGDGGATKTIEDTLRDENGDPVMGQQVEYFEVAGDLVGAGCRRR